MSNILTISKIKEQLDKLLSIPESKRNSNQNEQIAVLKEKLEDIAQETEIESGNYIRNNVIDSTVPNNDSPDANTTKNTLNSFYSTESIIIEENNNIVDFINEEILFRPEENSFEYIRHNLNKPFNESILNHKLFLFRILDTNISTTSYKISYNDIYGTSGNDELLGASSMDRIYGYAGNDIFYVDGGDDIIIGGDGIDTLSYKNLSGINSVTVNLATNTASSLLSGTDNITGIENIIGGKGDDTLLGDDNSNILTGGGNTELSLSIYNYSARASDYFGTGVSVYGNKALIGAEGEDTGGSKAGSAYIYDIVTGNLLLTINNPYPSSQEYFGEMVSINDKYAVITAPGNEIAGQYRTGSVYVFDVNNGNLLHTIDNPDPGYYDLFGRDNDIDGDIAIFGAYRDSSVATRSGMAYIYDLQTGNLLHTLSNPTPAKNDYFGYDTEISGNYAAVSAYKDGTGAIFSGSVYMFDVNTGNLLYTLNNPNPSPYDYFGYSMDMNNNYLAVAAPYYNDSATDSGIVYIYDVSTGNLLNTIYNPHIEDNDYFGKTLAISDDYVAISSYNDMDGTLTDEGQVEIFNILSGDLVATISSPNNVNSGEFGLYMNISDNTIIIGDPFNDNIARDAGAVYIYKMDFSGSDTINGAGGDDILYGLDGDDIIYGGAGNDTIYGGTGADDLYGDGGADRFTFMLEDAISAIDNIYDFNTSEGDIIDISNVLYNYDPITDAISDFVTFTDNGADSIMSIDIDGTGTTTGFVDAAIIIGGAGLDATALEASGNLDTVI